MAPHPIHGWFEKEVLSYRIFESLLRGLFVQLTILFSFSCLISFELWHPISWIQSNIGLFLTPSSWFYDTLIITSFICVAWVQAKDMKLTTRIPESKLTTLLHLSNPTILLSLVVNVLSGGLLARCLLGLQGGAYHSLTTSCGIQSSSTCLNDGHIFLVLSGSYLGLCLWFESNFRNGNVAEFPLINESGYFQLKRSVGNLLKISVSKVVSNLRWFYIGYVLIGYRMEDFLSDLFGVDLLRNKVQFHWGSNASEHLTLFITCVGLTSLISFCIRISNKIQLINFTKPWQLPTEDGLTEAIASENELLSHLACKDFATLSRERRAVFYTLSQPGHHPLNWNKLNGITLKKLDEFLRKLNESSQALRASHQAKHQEEEEQRKRVAAGPMNIPNIVNDAQQKTSPISKVISAIVDRCQRNSFLTSAPDAALRSVFAQSQTIIWLVEGLSHLVAASVNEDQFGVIQKDLPEILISLISLQQSVDRQKGLSSSSTKKSRCETKDHQLKQELRSTIKSSLSRIILAYGDSILEVQLPQEQRKKILNYYNFLEA